MSVRLDEDSSGPEGADDTTARFDTVVAALAEGDLTFASPFDYATSSALARNIDNGRIAEMLFAVDRLRRVEYVVHISTHSPDQPEIGSRVIVDTTVQSRATLITLLDLLVGELADKETGQGAHGGTSGNHEADR